MNILFCTDGSKVSMNALKNATEWFKEATIDAICVVDWGFLPESMQISGCSYEKTYSAMADTILEQAGALIKMKGFELKEKLKPCGSPTESILERLDKVHYDAVIMGSFGKKGIEKWLGSVSTQILNSSDTPIYISKRKTNAKKILFAADGTNSSNTAIKTACKMLDLTQKEIFVCTVQTPAETLFADGTLDENWIESIQKHQQAYSAQIIESAKNFIKKYGYETTEQSILTGNAAQKIIEFSLSREIDLIISGMKERSALSGFLTGSVSKRILEDSASDMFIIKTPKA